MKPAYLVAILSGVIGFVTPTWADTPPSEASQLLIQEEAGIAEFEYDADRLDTSESQINQNVSGEDQDGGNVVQLPDELGLPEDIILIESNGDYAIGTEF